MREASKVKRECACRVAVRLPEAEGRAPKGAQAAARVREADALAGVQPVPSGPIRLVVARF